MADGEIEYPWPRSSDEERHQMLLSGENHLLVALNALSQAAQTEGARRHVSAGLSRRLLVLQHCRKWLRDECEKHESTVDPHVSTQLSVYVNAYYVQLCGALDNLAWALVYEFKLVDPVDEEDFGTQKLAVLTGPKFAAAIGQAHPLIASRVQGTANWHTGLRKLRDPAAHRLPLMVVAGVLDTKDHDEWKRLHAQAASEIANNNVDNYFELIFRASRLGKFRPWLENPAGYQEGFYFLPNLIARDQAFFVDLAGAVVTILLQRLGATIPLSTLWGHPGAGSPWPVGAYLKAHEPYGSSFDFER